MKQLVSSIVVAGALAATSFAAPAFADESVQQLVDALRAQGAQAAQQTAAAGPYVPAAGAKASQVQITVKINIKSAIPKDAKPTCSGYALHFNNKGVSFQENATVISTRTGATATCVIAIPFAWPEANLAGTIQANASIYWGGVATGLISRSSSRSAVAIPMPAEGGVAKLSLDFTL